MVYSSKKSALQPRGVMVAQVILVHFVEVRILTGLPFFLPEFRAKNMKPEKALLHTPPGVLHNPKDCFILLCA